MEQVFLKEKVIVGKKKEKGFCQNFAKFLAKKLKNGKGLNKKFAKSLILLVGREGIEPSTY